ncbi:MAG: hypothetical protein A2655_02315 [Candidatus Yanofskybacteria bacterium RIFCSPHIGHO2_01_FULL_43_42]|uniref:DUF4012 domain-containing protein n=1 Tax=Candidatus Yanofskybacteria bacterium RIFCSPLOWO2_01_FULL_43_22 TaxID=1802695 RepID=A0A1F8GHC6_9BACT|nr:MAG: hypothetical protein A2655_02315 [Candidatus Yanofskybacteria bacterium RIFCSPHIGHO2_01_FULL_43_42]OGN13297.1 MAG: hypothetical protein A3D48_03220 [Candidatus Yanofskybacteria bacterium RIFCSPHIGHO2_02_FULL_43_17]OGN24713.1 MAG: hypothetical protein A3A13_01445 [Candidatus Yanofskybacteria bacterium RIFCSPLOWO2_01_FULL_43_22]
MSDKKPNILKALFDIKPVDDSGLVDVRKIAKVAPVVNLASVKTKPSELSSRADEKFFSPREEFEAVLSQTLDVAKEIKSIGGETVMKKKAGRPRYRPIFAKQKSEVADPYQAILSQINQRVAPVHGEGIIGEPRKIDPISLGMMTEKIPGAASSEIESWAKYARNSDNKATENSRQGWNKNYELRITGIFNPEFLIRSKNYLFRRNNFLTFGVVGFSALIFTSFGQYGISVKNEVLRESNLAVANLEQANESLRVFDFEAASNDFAEAYGEFSKAGESLNFMGASITSLFAELPGAGKLKSAKNLVEAGKLLAEAGKSMSEAVTALSKTSLILMMSDVVTDNDVRHQNIFSDLKKSFASSSKNLSKASALLSDVNAEALPEDKRESFLEFQSKLPEFRSIVSDAVEYTSFLENLLGSNGTKKYLILFQNNSELRPTGGFPGTYAVVTFKDGRLAGFLVDDVYNLDGQLKENIIPPKPLQHITPNWGMRDANWFIDFSVSAQKTMEFFNKEAGYDIDGVITMSPRMISDILKVVGPIEMPEYGFSINDENFLSTIQAEVEYGDNREQPKKVVLDMAPKLLERINSSDPGKWLDIFSVFISGLDKKDVLMYFKDLNLEQFVADKGFGGLIKNTDEDYLMITFTNVKGSKTDIVTDNSIKVSVRFEEGRMVHKIELTRQHNGGSTRYGFYNKQNPAYVRVLVPEGSELVSISGNSDPGYKPLINYSGSDFKQDGDLLKLESGFHPVRGKTPRLESGSSADHAFQAGRTSNGIDNENGVSTYSESGKTGFAFWLITDPGKQKTVELEYVVSVQSNNIYVQKQPGLEVDNFEFQVGDSLLYYGEFNKDLELKFKLE